MNQKTLAVSVIASMLVVFPIESSSAAVIGARTVARVARTAPHTGPVQDLLAQIPSTHHRGFETPAPLVAASQEKNPNRARVAQELSKPLSLFVYEFKLTPSQRALWKQLNTGYTPEQGFQFLYTSWLMDSTYAIAQSARWAIQTGDADYLRQILFAALLFRDPKTGRVQFCSAESDLALSQRTEWARLQDGVLSIGDHEFKVEGSRITGWRQTPWMEEFETLTVPAEIPTAMLNQFTLRA